MRSKKIVSTLAAISMAVSCFVGFATGASAADTYDIVFGTAVIDEAGATTGVDAVTDFGDHADATTLATDIVTMEGYSISGSCIQGNKAGGRQYYFSNPVESGKVVFSADVKLAADSTGKTFFNIVANTADGETYNIIQSPLNLKNSTSGTGSLIRIFEKEEAVVGAYILRNNVLHYDITIDLDRKQITYSISYPSRGSSGNVSQYSTTTDRLVFPDDVDITSISGLELPRVGRAYDATYMDNLKLYAQIPETPTSYYKTTFSSAASIDGATVYMLEDGVWSDVTTGVYMPNGSHQYYVTAPGYKTYYGTAVINGTAVDNTFVLESIPTNPESTNSTANKEKQGFFTETSGDINIPITLDTDDTGAVEFDIYVPAAQTANVTLGGANNTTGPNIQFVAEQSKTTVRYAENSSTNHDVGTYDSEQWVHVKIDFKTCDNTTNNGAIKLESCSITVTPSTGKPFTFTPELRNLAAGYSDNSTNYQFTQVKFSGVASFANAEIYVLAIPTITAATTTAAVDGTTLPAFDETTTFYNTDGTEATPDVTGKEVTTVYAKITNATEGVKPTITVDDGTEKIESTTWEPVPGTNIYFAQFVGTFEDFGTIIVSYPNATTVTVLEPAAEETE